MNNSMQNNKDECFEDNYIYLNRKEIIEILDGDIEVGKCDLYKVKMPYLKGVQLVRICNEFGLTMEYDSRSRWEYLSELLKFVYENHRTDELLQYMFDMDKFYDLSELSSPEEIESAHKHIVESVIKKINSILYLGKHTLRCIDGHFYVVDVSKKTVIGKRNINTVNISYVQDLLSRCEQDLNEGHYDSVVTKSRTLIEEVLIYILEQNNIEIQSQGNIKKLYAQVKALLNMCQNKDFDKRVNELLSGLEKIVNSISDMRNINSDAHGVGKNRIKIRDCEAKLIMNSAIVFCEYILNIQPKD